MHNGKILNIFFNFIFCIFLMGRDFINNLESELILFLFFNINLFILIEVNCFTILYCKMCLDFSFYLIDVFDNMSFLL